MDSYFNFFSQIISNSSVIRAQCWPESRKKIKKKHCQVTILIFLVRNSKGSEKKCRLFAWRSPGNGRPRFTQKCLRISLRLIKYLVFSFEYLMSVFKEVFLWGNKLTIWWVIIFVVARFPVDNHDHAKH